MRVGLFQPVHASPSAFLKAFCVFILVVLLRRWVHSAMNGKSCRWLVCAMRFSFLFQFYYVNLNHSTTNGYKNTSVITKLFSGNFLLCLKSSINTCGYCALFWDLEHSEENFLQLSILLVLNATRTPQIEVTGTVLPSSPAAPWAICLSKLAALSGWNVSGFIPAC